MFSGSRKNFASIRYSSVVLTLFEVEMQVWCSSNSWLETQKSNAARTYSVSVTLRQLLMHRISPATKLYKTLVWFVKLFDTNSHKSRAKNVNDGFNRG